MGLSFDSCHSPQCGVATDEKVFWLHLFLKMKKLEDEIKEKTKCLSKDEKKANVTFAKTKPFNSQRNFFLKYIAVLILFFAMLLHKRKNTKI